MKDQGYVYAPYIPAVVTDVTTMKIPIDHMGVQKESEWLKISKSRYADCGIDMSTYYDAIFIDHSL